MSLNWRSPVSRGEGGGLGEIRACPFLGKWRNLGTVPCESEIFIYFMVKWDEAFKAKHLLWHLLGTVNTLLEINTHKVSRLLHSLPSSFFNFGSLTMTRSRQSPSALCFSSSGLPGSGERRRSRVSLPRQRKENWGRKFDGGLWRKTLSLAKKNWTRSQ